MTLVASVTGRVEVEAVDEEEARVLRMGVGVVEVVPVGRTELLPRDEVPDNERKVDVGEGLVELVGVLRVVDIEVEAVPGALTRLVVVVRLAGVVVKEDVRGRRTVEVVVFVVAEEAMDARLAEREGPGVEDGLPLCGEDDDVVAASELEATRRVALVIAGRVELERIGVEGDFRTVEVVGGARVLAAAVLEAAILEAAVVVVVEEEVEEGVRVEEAVEAALLKVVGIAGRGLIGVFVVDDALVAATGVGAGLTLEAAAVAVAAARNAAVVNGFLADV